MPNANWPHTDLPRQRLPHSEKDTEWEQDTIDAIIDLSDFHPPFDHAFRDQMRKAYLYYNGQIEDEDYTHVTKPHGQKRQNFPAKLHNYPIIKPVVDLLIGEKARRPLDFTVKVNNDDVSNRKLEEKSQALQQNVIDHFLTELREQGLPVDELAPDEMPEPPERVMEQFEDGYRDERAEMGQHALNYLIEDLNLDRQFEKGFKHWLISGMVCSSRGVGMAGLDYEILNPLRVDYEKSPDTEYIEDAQWAVHRRLSTVNDVIDAFYDELTEKEINQLEHPDRDHDPFIIFSDVDEEEHDGRLIEVMEVYWKSMKRVGILTYRDANGFLQKRQVEENYDVGEDEEVEWYWVTEVWQGYRIDEDIYVRVGPLDMQRRDLDNVSRAKLPINGKKYSDMNAPNISLVMLGIPYQISYNIYKYRLENAIARSKGVIAQLDINMVPEDWSMDEWMNWVDASGVAWTDYTEGQLSPQHQAVLDLSVQTIEQYTVLLQSIIQEWERLSGVTRQRQGQITQHETKGGAEAAIVQSSYVTEDYHNQYNHFEEKELNAILDYSRKAWVSGASMSYVLPDGSMELFEIDGIQHMESEYGIRVSNSGDDLENIQELKQLAQAMMQNGVGLDTIAEILEADSLMGIKDHIEEAEQKRRELELAQTRAQMQQSKQETALKREEHELERYKAKLDSETDITVAQIEAGQDEAEREHEADMQEDEQEHEKEIERIQQKAEVRQNGTS